MCREFVDCEFQPGSGLVAKVIHSKDDTVLLADVLNEFPVRGREWEEEKVGKLTVHSKQGITFGRCFIIWGGVVKEHFGIDRNAAANWTLDGVIEDPNSIYLQVSLMHGDSDQQSRLICLTPEKSKQLKAHMAKSEFYLTVSEFRSEDEARKDYESLVKRFGSQKDALSKIELWSVRRANAHALYCLVLPASKRELEKNEAERVSKLFEVEIRLVAASALNEVFDLEVGE